MSFEAGDNWWLGGTAANVVHVPLHSDVLHDGQFTRGRGGGDLLLDAPVDLRAQFLRQVISLRPSSPLLPESRVPASSLQCPYPDHTSTRPHHLYPEMRLLPLSAARGRSVAVQIGRKKKTDLAYRRQQRDSASSRRTYGATGCCGRCCSPCAWQPVWPRQPSWGRWTACPSSGLRLLSERAAQRRSCPSRDPLSGPGPWSARRVSDNVRRRYCSMTTGRGRLRPRARPRTATHYAGVCSSAKKNGSRCPSSPIHANPENAVLLHYPGASAGGGLTLSPGWNSASQVDCLYSTTAHLGGQPVTPRMRRWDEKWSLSPPSDL